MNEEQIWYLYQNDKQLGPFDSQQLTQLYNNNMILQNSYIFKIGWKDWRKLEEGLKEAGIMGDDNPADARSDEAKRAKITGRVVVHNDGQLLIGKGLNISTSGVFVQTAEHQKFNLGEKLKISMRCNELNKAFNGTARVVRFNTNESFPRGIGLSFEDISENIREDIQKYIKQTVKGHDYRKSAVN